MAYGILIQNMVAAMNVDSYNRSAVAGSATNIDNGNVFRLDSQSSTTGQSEVWSATAPASGSLNNLWMAYSPEIVTISVNGKDYRGLNVDPRDFTNVGGKVFDAFKPQVGDVITMTAPAISGSPSTGDYVNSGSSVYSLAWGAIPVASSFSLKLIKETYVSLGTGGVDTQRVLAYKLQVVAN